MKFIPLFILIFCIICQVNADKYDYLEFSYSDIGFDYACSYYTLKNPDFQKMSIQKLESLGINNWNNVIGSIKNPVLEWEHHIKYNITKYNYSHIEKNITCINQSWKNINGSFYCGIKFHQCDKIKTSEYKDDTCIFLEYNQTGKFQETKINKTWQKVSPIFELSSIEIYPQESKNFRICAEIQRRNTKNGYQIKVDHIPKFDNFIYNKWSWWNSTYTKRIQLDCSNISSDTPLCINGSNGFNLGCGKTIVWSLCNGTNTSIYYNNCSDFQIANTNSNIPFEVEYGNGTSYNPSNVWNSNYDAVYHFSKTGNDSTKNNRHLIIGANVSHITTGCSFGSCYYFLGNQGSYGYFEPYTKSTNSPFSFEGHTYRIDSSVIYPWIFGTYSLSGVMRIGVEAGSEAANIANFSIYSQNGGRHIGSPFSLLQRYYIFSNFDGTNMNLSYNNIFDFSAVAGYQMGIESINIGLPYHTYNNFGFEGMIDEVRFSNICRGNDYQDEIWKNKNNYDGYGNLGEIINLTTNITSNITNISIFHYFGSKNLCIFHINGSETCLNHSNSTLLNLSHDHLLKLKFIPIEKTTLSFFEKLEELTSDQKIWLSFVTVVILIMIIKFLIQKK